MIEAATTFVAALPLLAALGALLLVALLPAYRTAREALAGALMAGLPLITAR